ncbi:MAG: N-6 DNA methylase [Candidatus Lokiarchaeota archaeon]|nr:N-6 DNA methylase [Candidatus Lokiarchaeota archaeon]
MNEREIGKQSLITSLSEIGFTFLPNTKNILQKTLELQKGKKVTWIWSFCDQIDCITNLNKHNSSYLIIHINRSPKNIIAALFHANSSIEFFNEDLNSKSTSFVRSILRYFAEYQIQLDSQSIQKIFGLDSFFYHLAQKLMETSEFDKIRWKTLFIPYYDEGTIDDLLLFSHSYLSFLLKLFILKQTENTGLTTQNLKSKLQAYPSFCDVFFTKDLFSGILYNIKLTTIFDCLIPKLNFQQVDLFSIIFQELISLKTRQSLGEVYTPSSLIRLMVQKKISDQESFLDPACGTGSFLIEIYSHLKETEKLTENTELYGIDVNPLSVMATITNFYLLQQGTFPEKCPQIKIFHADALISEDNPSIAKVIEKKVDFIIGNPPWINISGIYRREYKEFLKNLAKQLNILYPIESKNTEICTIFFNQSRNLYLKKGGEIFFIFPASVLNGRQHVYFRYFPGFKDIEIWRFKQDIFKIHSICLYARNSGQDQKPFENREALKKRLILSSFLLSIDNNGDIIQDSRKRIPLIPIYIKDAKNGSFPLVGRYNPLSLVPKELQSVVPTRSPYYSQVKGGLRIVPRRWVVIQEHPPFNETVIIHPDMSQQAKSQWITPPYKKAEVESKYIHEFVKSEFLIPYTFVQTKYAFIPIRPTKKAILERNVIETSHLLPYASKFYRFLDAEYRKRIKKSASMPTLADNFTYNGRLLPTNVILQSHEVMVVHNSIGSIVKSAVIRHPLLLDNSLYYIILENIEEAYYLCGVLNSNLMTSLVRLIGSTGSRGSLRNIHKNPYNFSIPHYSSSPLQNEIANLCKKIERYVQRFVLDSQKSTSPRSNKTEQVIIKPRTIQNRLLTDLTYKEYTFTLDSLVREILIH